MFYLSVDRRDLHPGDTDRHAQRLGMDRTWNSLDRCVNRNHPENDRVPYAAYYLGPAVHPHGLDTGCGAPSHDADSSVGPAFLDAHGRTGVHGRGHILRMASITVQPYPLAPLCDGRERRFLYGLLAAPRLMSHQSPSQAPRIAPRCMSRLVYRLLFQQTLYDRLQTSSSRAGG